MVTFDEFYSGYFKDRWNTLRAALLTSHYSFPLKTDSNEPYFMDISSVLASLLFAETLKTYANTLLHYESESMLSLLDACSAPGGKLLAATRYLTAHHVPFTILANELSSNRRRILANVVKEHCNPALQRSITISGFDAARAGSKKTEHKRFHGILLDVPCSSERHVIQDAQAYASWTPARIKSLSQRQWSLLSSAFLLAKDNAVIAYITCAMTAQENDDIIERALKKYGPTVQVLPSHALAEHVLANNFFACLFNEAKTNTGESYSISSIQFESTKYGIALLPDISNGAGPLYIAMLLKHSE